MRNALRKLDHAVYRVERAVAGALFLFMALVMFASVLHRIYSREEGRLSSALLALLRALGFSPDPATIHGPVSAALNLAIAFGLAYGALRTMKLARPPSRRRAAAMAAGIAAALGMFVKGILVALPNGLDWANVVALACMLWVGFLGASIATYEKKHLALEMGEKIWPPSLLPYVGGLAKVATAGLTVFLLYLAVISLRDHYAGWIVNHLAGNLLPTSIPKWAVFVIFPYTFVVMSLRFLGGAVSSLSGADR